jgi:DNA-binding NtrC family response regulator
MGTETRAPSRILLINRDSEESRHVQAALETQGYAVSASRCGDPAIHALQHGVYDVVLLCACKPGEDGLFVLLRARELQLDAQFIVLSDDKAVDTAVRAMQLGAADYVQRPLNIPELALRIERALERTAIHHELVHLRRKARLDSFAGIVGQSETMRRVFDLIERVATTRASVLVTGETGTGKELIARAIHELSPRRLKPWVPVSCSAVPEHLIESELFGHARGSFTGAVTERRGLFEDASGGTIFLDEIDAMPVPTQAKLLRVVEERTIQRIGASHDIAVDFRLIAASNTDLAAQVREGAFREDLYYRLNVFPIVIPPLRERRSDIPILARYFRDMAANATGLDAIEFPPNMLHRMEQYDWPGNVRELRNYVERSLILSAGRDVLEALPLHDGTNGVGPRLESAVDERWSLDRLEQEYIRVVLDHTRGNRNRAARFLGIDRRTLYRRIRQLQG